MSNILRHTATVALFFVLGGCGGSPDQARVALPKDCPITMLKEPPEQELYTHLGFCDIATPGDGLVADLSEKGMAKVHECACSFGGNAVLYIAEQVQNDFGLPPRFQGKGVVMWVEPDSLDEGPGSVQLRLHVNDAPDDL